MWLEPAREELASLWLVRRGSLATKQVASNENRGKRRILAEERVAGCRECNVFGNCYVVAVTFLGASEFFWCRR